MDTKNDSINNLVTHTFEPVWNKESKVLILGTIPSPKSREFGFYYSHPQNRLWKVLAELFSQEVPISIDEKKSLLLANKVAMWDVLQSCKIKNADDNTISEPIVNDIPRILQQSDIKAIFTTGRKATELYNKYCMISQDSIQSIYLPSTSPANCRINFQNLVEEYRIILNYIHLPNTL